MGTQLSPGGNPLTTLSQQVGGFLPGQGNGPVSWSDLGGSGGGTPGLPQAGISTPTTNPDGSITLQQGTGNPTSPGGPGFWQRFLAGLQQGSGQGQNSQSNQSPASGQQGGFMNTLLRGLSGGIGQVGQNAMGRGQQAPQGQSQAAPQNQMQQQLMQLLQQLLQKQQAQTPATSGQAPQSPGSFGTPGFPPQ